MKEMILLVATLACFVFNYLFVSKIGAFFDQCFQSDCLKDKECDTMGGNEEDMI